MARRRKHTLRSILPTIGKVLIAYEVGAYAFNWYQAYSNPTTGGATLPLDGIGLLIGYPGSGSSAEGLIQSNL